MNIHNNEVKGAIILSFCGILYSTYGIYSRFMGNTFAPFYQVWSRAGIILIVLSIFLLLSKKITKVNNIDLKWLTATGLSGAFIDVLFFIAVNRMPIGIVLFGFYSVSTIFSFIWGKVLFGETITKIKFFSIVIAVIGLLCMYYDSLQRISSDYLGLLLVFGSGVFASIYFTFSKKISNSHSFLQIAVINNLFKLFGMFIVSYLLKEQWYDNFISFSWGINFLFAITQAIIMSLVVLGFRYIEAQKGGLFLLLELVFGMIFGAIFFKEIPSVFAIVGAGIILFAMIIPMVDKSQK